MAVLTLVNGEGVGEYLSLMVYAIVVTVVILYGDKGELLPFPCYRLK